MIDWCRNNKRIWARNNATHPTTALLGVSQPGRGSLRILRHHIEDVLEVSQEMIKVVSLGENRRGRFS